jgi:hypothetical protein
MAGAATVVRRWQWFIYWVHFRLFRTLDFRAALQNRSPSSRKWEKRTFHFGRHVMDESVIVRDPGLFPNRFPDLIFWETRLC